MKMTQPTGSISGLLITIDVGAATPHTGRRRSPFGAATISGLRKLRLIWRRRRWKYCAAVVGKATFMFTFAHVCVGSKRSSVSCPRESVCNLDRYQNSTCSMRSSREEECSGPAPSRPWGRSRTIPLCFSHLAVEDINIKSKSQLEVVQITYFQPMR